MPKRPLSFGLHFNDPGLCVRKSVPYSCRLKEGGTVEYSNSLIKNGQYIHLFCYRVATKLNVKELMIIPTRRKKYRLRIDIGKVI